MSRVARFRGAASLLAAGLCATTAAAAAGAIAAAPAPAPAPATTPAVWQEHRGSIDYTGLTSVFTCSGIENKLRQLFLLLGARPDMRINASGCGPGDMPMGRFLSVSVRVYTLAPVDPAAAPGATPPLPAQWSPIEIGEHRPMGMGPGDCELVEQMRGFVEKNFTSRGVEYRAACQPRSVTPDSYGVRGEFLKTAAP